MNLLDYLKKNYQLKKEGSSSLKRISAHTENLDSSAVFVMNDKNKNYLGEASQRAGALLVPKNEAVDENFQGFLFEYEGRLRLDKLLNDFYENPSEKLFLVGVTGTNGKTSFCYFLEHIFESCGWPCGVIGTVDQHFKKINFPSRLTTPSAPEIYEKLDYFHKKGAKAMALELSSHAISQGRVKGLDFKALIFSNLSPDHLDYHENMQDYFDAKKKIFLEALKKGENFFVLSNKDDEWGEKIYKLGGPQFFSFGKNPSSDFQFEITKQSLKKTEFVLTYKEEKVNCQIPHFGEYNVYNAVSALATATLTGFSLNSCVKALKSLPCIPGRMQEVKSKAPFQVFVDYAHTPKALSSLLKPLKKEALRLLLVFGCGGDRDKDKRKSMLEEALTYADLVFFTSDNPRNEDPGHIASSTFSFFSKQELEKVRLELDREKAILKALKEAKKGDVVIIAGKGHENYQIIKEKRLPFLDFDVAKKFLKEWK